MTDIATIDSIQICPVKSMGAVQLEEAILTPGGLLGDREFAVVAADAKNHGEFDTITRREKPELALFSVAFYNSETLRLSYPDHGHCTVKIDRSQDGDLKIKHYQHTSIGADQGEEVSRWLTSILGPHKDQELRLVRFVKPLETTEGSYTGNFAPTGFMDRHPVTVAATSSLDELNRKLTLRDLPTATMTQFAPSISLRGLSPFEEHSVAEVGGDDFKLRMDVPIPRCGYVHVDPATGIELGKEGPLKTLKEVNPLGEVAFGECCSVVSDGHRITIRRGQRLRVVQDS